MAPCDQLVFNKIIVHPVVLLSVADHYNRIRNTENGRRVVGVLLGYVNVEKSLEVINCFAVPFDEDQRDDRICYFDEDYMGNMAVMFNKVAAKEKIIGWYHTGSQLQRNDITIHKIVQKYCRNPILFVVDLYTKEEKTRWRTYELNSDKELPIFEYVVCEVAGDESEEVVVEHLLRNFKNQMIGGGTLSERIDSQRASLGGLANNLDIVKRYLDSVRDKRLPPNVEVLNMIQDLFNLLLTTMASSEFDAAGIRATNDHLIFFYLGTLIRTIIAFHDLIMNKERLLNMKDEEPAESSKKVSFDILKTLPLI